MMTGWHVPGPQNLSKSTRSQIAGGGGWQYVSRASVGIVSNFAPDSSVPKAQPYVSPGWSDVRNERRVTLGQESKRGRIAPNGAALTSESTLAFSALSVRAWFGVLFRATPLGLAVNDIHIPGLRHVRCAHVAPPWAGLGSSLRDWNDRRQKIEILSGIP